MFLTQVASLSSHSSMRERICPPNRGPCFRTSSLAASENWDRLTGLYLSRVRRSFTTGKKAGEHKALRARKTGKLCRRIKHQREMKKWKYINTHQNHSYKMSPVRLLKRRPPPAHNPDSLPEALKKSNHWFNHLLIQTDSSVCVCIVTCLPLRPPVLTVLLLTEEIHKRWSAGYWSQCRISGHG